MSGDEFTEALMKATAALAELQPTNATEAMLGAQRVGTQRAVMVFLYDAMRPGQQVEVVDRHVNRAARLMRVFNEQVETMARLKGKGGQQRVIVEHVTVAASGQAIVGAVLPGGGGTSGTDRG